MTAESALNSALAEALHFGPLDFVGSVARIEEIIREFLLLRWKPWSHDIALANIGAQIAELVILHHDFSRFVDRLDDIVIADNTGSPARLDNIIHAHMRQRRGRQLVRIGAARVLGALRAWRIGDVVYGLVIRDINLPLIFVLAAFTAQDELIFIHAAQPSETRRQPVGVKGGGPLGPKRIRHQPTGWNVPLRNWRVL